MRRVTKRLQDSEPSTKFGGIILIVLLNIDVSNNAVCHFPRNRQPIVRFRWRPNDNISLKSKIQAISNGEKVHLES